MEPKSIQIVWFKRDLRITDHIALTAAASTGAVLPLYVAEPDYWAGSDTSSRQWSFIRESLMDLRSALAGRGQPLVVRVGDVVTTLSELHRQIKIDRLWSHEETGNRWTFERDIRVAGWCRQHSVRWTELTQNGVIRGLSDRDGWARKRGQFMTASMAPALPPMQPLERFDIGPIPHLHDLGLSSDCCPFRQIGGLVKGRERLKSFLDSRDANYRSEISSPITAETTCSRLSPHLAFGTLSIREVAQATDQELKKNSGVPRARRQSLLSFSSRLHWHCHFMQKLENQPELEFINMHPAYNELRVDDAKRLEAWCRGETGWPFVDACMRMLRATGWINFRMRAMLMAVASYHLWMNWRQPGEHLARMFTDYEPGIHWPQIQMQSGTTGINLPRIYNPVKQGYDQDPSGSFIRRWVPELSVVPDALVHEPWTWEEADQRLDDRYPRVLVDYKEAAKRARQIIWSVRKSESYQANAKKIYERHGSRKKTGLFRAKNPRPRQTVRRADAPQQLTLFECAAEMRPKPIN